jgi:hypothetical protein
LAAYIAIWTGLGLSLATATYLRWGLIFIAIASLLFLIGQHLHRIGALVTSKRKLNHATQNRK